MRQRRLTLLTIILGILAVPSFAQSSKISRLAWVFLFVSCSEPFPTYQEPSSVLESNLEVFAVDTIDVIRDRETGQWYLVSAPITFIVRVTNTHDDLLSGNAAIDGSIDVTAFTVAARSFSVGFVEGNLVAPQIVGGELALEPGGEALFRTIMYPVLPNGDLLIDGEPGGPIYGPIACVAEGTIKVFTQVQTIEVPRVEFQLTFRESYDAP